MVCSRKKVDFIHIRTIFSQKLFPLKIAIVMRFDKMGKKDEKLLTYLIRKSSVIGYGGVSKLEQETNLFQSSVPCYLFMYIMHARLRLLRP